MKAMMTAGLASACISMACAAEEWTPLLGGDSLDAWMSADGGQPGDGWKIADGVLHRAGGAGDLISREEFENFELRLEWRISEGGNSGVKYRLRKTDRGWLGAEYQVLDDEHHPNGSDPRKRAASLYDVMPADSDKELAPAGEWNETRILVEGTTIKHWLNGEKVLEADTSSGEWTEAKKDSKFDGVDGFAEPGPGRLLLQDHSDEVWFRNVRVRELED